MFSLTKRGANKTIGSWEKALNAVAPGSANIYKARFSTSINSSTEKQTYAKRFFTSSDDSQSDRRVYVKKSFADDSQIKYTPIFKLEEYQIKESSKKLLKSTYPSYREDSVLALDLNDKKSVFQTALKDVETTKEEEFGKILILSGKGGNIRYGDWGMSPSKEFKPEDLLKYNLEIPDRSFGMIDICHHTPFRIEAENATDLFALPLTKPSKVVDFDKIELDKIGLIETIVSLPSDTARMTHIKIQERIFGDRENEKFYEETTSRVDKPNFYNRSSGTLMNFEREETGVDKTTDSHYHPGDRILHIFTIGKKAGVKLNFCGIAENPDERHDCESSIEFPKNSLVILKFPAYTHHKFEGDFVCLSCHPKEGPNIINALETGTLPAGFLESATVFSATQESQEKWHLSLPDNTATDKSLER